jgi:general secretion pathway protein G
MKTRNSIADRRQAREDGFTLIEIMVVVVILGILAALVAPNVISRIDDAQINRAKQDIRAVESALHLYRLDNFRYPTTDQGLEALVNQPADPSIRNWRAGGYLDKIPVDPWGTPYQYLQPGQNGEFDVFTLGADQQPGGEGINGDIGNWNID